jgi:glycosyltransferase involved in cell wall biosynthesis
MDQPAPLPTGTNGQRPHRLLRIALVTETYPPEVNGVALSVARLARGLVDRQHSLQLVRPRQQSGETPCADARFVEVLVRGMPIPRYPHLKMGLPATRTLRTLWHRQRPDLVHIATEGPLGASALRAARQLGLPVSSDFRTNFQAYSRHYGVGWLDRAILAYLRRFHNRTGCTMVPTEALRGELAGHAFENLEVLPRGIDTTLFHPSRRDAALRRSWGAADDDLVVLHVGRLAPEKNLGLLVDAFEAMRAQVPNARLVLVGDGPSRGALQRRCPDAVFAGSRSDTDLAAHYASGDVFIFPSKTETFGNVTPEAMASALAVLAFDHAAAGQLIRSGDNGLLAPLDDDAAFVRQARVLALDPAARAAFGPRARSDVAELGWERIIAQLEAVFEAVIDGARKPDVAGFASGHSWRGAA